MFLQKCDLRNIRKLMLLRSIVAFHVVLLVEVMYRHAQSREITIQIASITKITLYVIRAKTLT